MSLNLNVEIDRRGTNSVKWEFMWQDEVLTYMDHADLDQHDENRTLPMWVADMDFRCPQPVIDALAARVQHGIFGYTAPTESYYTAVINWFQRRYNWTIEKEWILLSPGVVPAINFLTQAFIQPGDKVIIQRPVYYPFARAIENNGGEIVNNGLIYENGRYHMDFDDLAQKAADPAAKMIILCSPHNPISRVWSAEELRQLGEICIQNNVIVVSDEIHCDLLFKGQTFIPFATLGEKFAQNSIICTAPSKTFNLAGLKVSNIIIQNEEWRQEFAGRLMSNGLIGTNTFGPVATEAAYTHGEPWLDEVMAYVEANYEFMVAYLAEHLPQVSVIKPEATYLIWADFSKLGLTHEERQKLIFNNAGVFLDEGSMFGPEGADFERFNLACPRPILEEALARIVTAVSNYEG